MTHLCLFISAGTGTAARIRRGIEACGFRIVGAEGLGPAIDSLRQWRFDAVVFDANGQGPARVSAVSLLRARCAAPIVVLDEPGSEERQLQCLAAGATDVVALAASPRLVGWKLRQLVQAVAAHRPPPRQELRLGRLRLDPARGSAHVDGLPLDLSGAEFDTLFVLAARAGQLVGRGDLGGASSSLRAALGRSIDTRIYRIRRHLEAMGATELELTTVHGRGYRLSLAGRIPTQGSGRPAPRSAEHRPAGGLSERRSGRP
jgi:DNA-binding response OmpR family regulator